MEGLMFRLGLSRREKMDKGFSEIKIIGNGAEDVGKCGAGREGTSSEASSSSGTPSEKA
jgi:hypothetical protein